MKKFDRSKFTYFVLSAFIISLFLFFSYSRALDEFEYSLLDLRYKLRPVLPVDKNIVIVEIADDSIEKLGKWPFPRKYHALMVKALKSAGAKKIVFDIFFSEEKEGDEELASAIKEEGNVYLPYVFDLDLSGPDKSFLQARGYAAEIVDILKNVAKGEGFINAVPDPDGKIRRIPLFIGYKGMFYPHMTFLVSLNYMGASFDKVKIAPGRKIIVDKNFTVPIDDTSMMLVNYPGPWGKAFRHYSYVDIMQSYLADITNKEPVLDLAELKDAVCFVGLTATAALDAHPSPTEPLYPGVGVHASLLNSMIHKSFLMRLNRWWNLLILIIMWVITTLITIRVRKRFGFLSIILIILAFSSIAILLFYPFGIWIDMFYPIFTMVGIYIVFTFRKYVKETQRRELLEKELNIAKEIQRSFLPLEIPKVGELDIDVEMLTARQVGGDLYDVVKLDDTKAGVMIGDVAGKGVPASLFMARVVTEFKTFIGQGSPQEILKKLNDRFVSEGTGNLFVTLTYMVVDTGSKRIEFASGGHLPIILVEADGKVEFLDVEEGLPLGLAESVFSLGKRNYKPGSVFLLYTDGVTEAMNIKDEMFGKEKLTKLLLALKERPSEEIVKGVQKAVEEYAGRAAQHDDITVIAIKT